MCLGFITIFCPLNISFPTNAQAKWKISSKTALLRTCSIIDSARREKEKTRGEEKARSRCRALRPGAAVSNPRSCSPSLPGEGSCQQPELFLGHWGEEEEAREEVQGHPARPRVARAALRCWLRF